MPSTVIDYLTPHIPPRVSSYWSKGGYPLQVPDFHMSYATNLIITGSMEGQPAAHIPTATLTAQVVNTFAVGSIYMDGAASSTTSSPSSTTSTTTSTTPSSPRAYGGGNTGGEIKAIPQRDMAVPQTGAQVRHLKLQRSRVKVPISARQDRVGATIGLFLT
jgi:hypothetical protein